MTIKQLGGIFGTNPTFNNVEAKTLNVDDAVVDNNLLVGQSSTASPGVANTVTGLSISGQYDAIYVSRANDRPLVLNRNSDGVEIDIRRSGVTIGSIGVVNSDNLFLAGNSSHVGIGMGSTSIYGASQLGQIDDGAVDLGASNARWNDVYAVNGTIQTSDRNEKQDIEMLSDAERRVAVACKALLRRFRWTSSVNQKGDEARIHFGIIAQDLENAFTAEGLDAGRYGMFIHTTLTDEETGEEHSRMGVRYSELLAFIISAI